MSTAVWPGPAEVSRLLEAGVRGARRAGVSAIEDCAAEFVAAALKHPEAVLGPRDSPLPGEWLNRCALNFARNLRMREVRRVRLEAPWPMEENTVGAGEPTNCCDSTPGPEIQAGRPVFWKLVLEAVAQLSETQRLYLIRHHLEGESIAELSEKLGKTPHSIEQSLFRARRHVQDYLLAWGLTEAEWRQWAASFAPTAPAPRPLPPGDN